MQSRMHVTYQGGLVRFSLSASVKGETGRGEARARVVTWLQVRVQPTPNLLQGVLELAWPSASS